MIQNWKKNAALFLTGQALSIFGSMLVQYAMLWHITLKTGSGSMMSVFILAGILPMFFISPFAGVWADRFNKKYIINAADASIALVTLAIALCFIAGMESIWLLLVCSGLRAVGQGIQTPAVGAFIPEITPEEHLSKVNGINGGIQSFIMFTAPLLSGLLLTYTSITFIFFIDVVTAAAGIAIVFFFVKTGARKVQTEAGGTGGVDYFHDLKKGFMYIKSHKFILRLIVISTVFFIAVSPAAFLTAIQVTRNFGNDIWRLTAIEMTFSSGMMLGNILVGIWGGFKNRVYSMALSCALMGIEAASLGLTRNFVLYSAVMGIMGFTMPLYNTPSMVMLQTRVEPEYMGRVLSVFSMISSLMMPAGMLIWGPMADVVSIDHILVGTGAVIFALSPIFLVSKSLRAAGV
ncbi:MAG: MFS transporter [Spirochaetaceae bacterium]|jgi:DHA3 family macrolide efflux protein-like MFS transporter|nr:MFS transporter [Spirochaetaceae bacterium]